MTSPQPYVVGPYSAAHLYLQWGGKLPGNETWSCGMRLRKTGPPVTQSGDPSALIEGVATAVRAFHERPTSNINGSARLSFVKLNAITTIGTYMDPGNSFETVLPDVTGNGTYQVMLVPNQIAIAVTTLTGFTRGPAHSGRFYLPLPTMSVNGDGTVAAGPCDDLRASATTLINDVNAAAAGYELAVFSRKSGAAASRAITGCKVGRVLDTQRRRRRSLIEDYQ